MLSGNPHKGNYMVVIEAVENLLSMPPGTDEAHCFKEPEVMRYCREVHFEQVG